MPPIPRDFYRYANIKTATTTVIHATGKGGGLVAITINGGTMGSITIYDNGAASGTEVAIIAIPVAGQVFPYSAKLSTGLTIVTAAATNLTVTYA